jgi:hypothetical protein
MVWLSAGVFTDGRVDVRDGEHERAGFFDRAQRSSSFDLLLDGSHLGQRQSRHPFAFSDLSGDVLGS